MKQHKMPNGKLIDVPKGCSICLDKDKPDGKHFIWIVDDDVPVNVKEKFEEDIKNNCVEYFERDPELSWDDCAGIVAKGE